MLAYNAVRENKEVLFEGAQGTLLDIDFGTYPFVTSSHPVSGGVCVGSGVGPTLIDEVVGAAKAYTTRVGAGPFPTELLDATGDELRNRGHEFGTVTGRTRRCGWFDAVIMRHSVRVNGLTALAINKIDTLSGMGPLKVCTAYRKADGTVIRDFPPTIDELAECLPVYEELEGFDGDLSGCRSFDELPASWQALHRRARAPVRMPHQNGGRRPRPLTEPREGVKKERPPARAAFPFPAFLKESGQRTFGSGPPRILPAAASRGPASREAPAPMGGVLPASNVLRRFFKSGKKESRPCGRPFLFRFPRTQTPQISRAYSQMVRSEENLPALAVLRRHLPAKEARSR